MYLSSKSEGNKFLFSTISQFLFSSQIEASSRDRVKLEHDRADSDRLQMNGRSLPIHWGVGEGRNVRFRFSRALRPIDSEKLGISSGPLSSLRPFYVNASSVILEFQERRKDSVTRLIFTRDNFPISRPVHPILFESRRLRATAPTSRRSRFDPN